ncbi:hypothetical protein V6x_51710 [Gimesia chilikensis]|uniref:Uncharacterized protein n=1 Tax=Gimesia chilikensis TaxID=2605989 RepID=A0A517WJK0_9PLAN|nr:hypothetical protein [Gimesia chilikensis]KAA0134444.1 hypothetical protein FYZ48_20335 [Gimesia chilikensis]QDU05434.1 hypothetical protein V6x_51710 [Gimesia chilikensis]
MAFNVDDHPLDTSLILHTESRSPRKQKENCFGSLGYLEDDKLNFVTGPDDEFASFWFIKTSVTDPHKCKDAEFIENQLRKGEFGIAFICNPQIVCTYSIGILAYRKNTSPIEYISDIGISEDGVSIKEDDFDEGFTAIESRFGFDVPKGSDESQRLMFPYITGTIHKNNDAYTGLKYSKILEESKTFARLFEMDDAINVIEDFQNENLPYLIQSDKFSIPKSEQKGVVEVMIYVWINDSTKQLEPFMCRKSVEPKVRKVKFNFE